MIATVSPLRIPRPSAVTLALLVAIAWMSTHRYQGLAHDGMFYAGQAIFRLDSIAFAKDLFFAYGSQDNFTVFSGLYAWAVLKFGLPTASAVMLATAHVFWLSALVWLLQGIFRGPSLWLAVILVVTLPASYGSYGLLSYGESFLTARIWAEAPSLLAVACVLRGYRVWAVVAVAVAASIHPVIAFAPALFVFYYGFSWPQQLLLALLALGAIAGLNLAAIPPFAKLAEVMDPTWLGLATVRSPFVFLDQWRSEEYHAPLFLLLLLSTTAVCDVTRRRLWRAALAVLASGMGLALLAVFWPGVMLIQMQPWRVLWLGKVLAVAATVALWRTTWGGSPYSRLLLGALLACGLTVESTGLFCAVPVAVLIICWHTLHLEPRLPSWFWALAWGAIAVVVAENLFWRIALSALTLDSDDAALLQVTLADRLFILAKETGWLGFPAVLVGIYWLLRRRMASAKWMSAVFGLTLVYFAYHWQRTNDWQTAEERLQEAGIPELAALIQPQHLTYWPEGHHYLWFVLHRGSYASFHQAAGLIFSRQTAIEAERRLARLKTLGFPDSRFAWVPIRSNRESSASANLDSLIHVCHDPILDYVILSQPIQGADSVAAFSLHRPDEQYQLYACAPLRAFPDPYSAS